jgi:hypothetical protein
LETVETGDFARKGEGGLSDHVPVSVEISDSVVGIL